jgi:ABC-type oligopeptide transport system substrate-binding subunit
LKRLLTILAILGLTVTLAACGGGEEDPENTLPTISGVENANLTLGDTFDVLEGVTADDAEDGDLTDAISVSGTVDLDTVGTYTITYTVEDNDGGTKTVTRTIVVGDVDVTLPNGFYNYKFADTELRHTFMAAAEDYLMHNMYGGIPLFASGSFNLYSSRLQLPVDEYVAVMGYGTSFATMSEDDSTVKMDDGEFGEVGEYTYRTTVGANPGTFNQWLYDTSTDSDLMGVYMDALYTYVFNADKSGYEVVGSMASGDPVPVDSEILESGKEVATTWEVTVRDDLEWYFHPDTDADFLATNPDATIDANDFIDTFKIAVDESWFRAISGGGDFLAETSKIKNMQAYIDGTVGWDEVGLSVKEGDDLTLVFEFENDMSDWNVRYWLSSFVQSPINVEMYNYYQAKVDAGDLDSNPFGTSETTVAYHGAYYVSYYESGKVVRMEENPNFHSPDMYFFTGYTFSVITDATTIFNEFIAGKLEATGLPTPEVENYENDPRLRKVPGATTYRIMINGLETLEAAQELFPDVTWEPEPILANQYFKQAMFFALDRQTLAEDLLKVRTTNMYYFSNAYLVDAELGVPYRQTEQGMSVGADLSPDTWGYNFDAATNYFKAALDEVLAAGFYADAADATAADPYVITIELNNYADSESWDLACGYIKTAFEDAFQDDDRNIKVEVEIYTKDFPAIYYDYMMIGEFDLSVGGISGSTLDAASFLDTYSSDNRSGFTLNWGIDTSVAEIEVRYEYAGEVYRELWAYDAICSALNGEVFLIDGQEADVPAANDISYTPTTVDFTISEYNNVAYQDITYTIEWYSIDDDAYYDLDGYTNITPDGAEVTVTGLDPYYYGYVSDGSVLYQGDYQITINYVYASDTEKTGSTTSSWFAMGELLAVDSETLTDTSATWGLTVNQEDVADRAVATVTVFEEQADESMSDVTASVTVDFSDLTAASVSGLTTDAFYVVEIEFSDGTVTWLYFTAAAPAAE